MIKAGTPRYKRVAHGISEVDSGWSFIFVMLTVTTFMFGIGFGGALLDEGNAWGLPLVLSPIIPAIFWVTVWILRRNVVIDCGCRYSYSSGSPGCTAITNAWNQLNEDNQAITLPLVNFVYEKHYVRNSKGELMFQDACKQRIEAVEKLLDEQKELDYFVPEVDNGDVEAVLEYINAMKSARETLRPPAPIEAPKATTLTVTRNRLFGR